MLPGQFLKHANTLHFIIALNTENTVLGKYRYRYVDYNCIRID